MPIPKPMPGEPEKDFMERCMADDVMSEEYPDGDQRVAICASSYSEKSQELDMDDTFSEFETASLDVVADIKAEEDQGEGIFSGYASIFGVKDLGNDVVEAGAFTKSIRSKGAKKIKMLYQHDAKEVIGVYSKIREDGEGLYVEGQLAMGTQKGREVYELMKMGAIDGLSIGYRVDPKGWHYDEKRKQRYLKSVDLMEISAVTFPMNPKARVQAVKSDRSVREWEAFLRDEGGLSRSEAKMGASALVKSLSQRDVGSDFDELITSINNLTRTLTGD